MALSGTFLSLLFTKMTWGTLVMIPIEKRFKAGLLYVAGLMFQKTLPEVDQINYVTRINIPTIMMNGKYDHFFPLETSFFIVSEKYSKCADSRVFSSVISCFSK